MASLQNTSNYVKFVRGTRAAWEALLAQGNVHEDTLYFIYETAGASKGTLYLGTKQIGGAEGEMEIPVTLEDLDDVLFEEGLSAGDVLIYSGTKWINGSIADVLDFDKDVLELDEAGALTLLGFDSAEVGAIPQKDKSGKITWVKPGNLEEISQLNDQLDDIYTKGEINNLIASIDRLTYQKVEKLEDINVEDDNKIYLVPTEDDDNKYDEYMVIDGTIEPVGSWSVDLNDYVTIADFNTKVEELTSLITESNNELEGSIGAINSNIETLNQALETIDSNLTQLNNFKVAVGDLSKLVVYAENTTLVEQVNHLTEQLTWQEIVE